MNYDEDGTQHGIKQRYMYIMSIFEEHFLLCILSAIGEEFWVTKRTNGELLRPLIVQFNNAFAFWQRPFGILFSTLELDSRLFFLRENWLSRDFTWGSHASSLGHSFFTSLAICWYKNTICPCDSPFCPFLYLQIRWYIYLKDDTNQRRKAVTFPAASPHLLGRVCHLRHLCWLVGNTKHRKWVRRILWGYYCYLLWISKELYYEMHETTNWQGK